MCDFADLHCLYIERIRRPYRGRFATIATAIPSSSQTGRCSHCGGQLRVHGKKNTTYQDVPDQGGTVAIVVERLRYRCALCGTTSLQPVPEMDHKFRMTERLIDRIRMEAVQRPFSTIAKEVGIHEKTVRRIVRDRIPALTGSRSRGRHVVD
ncbi:transposase family protein [Bradyrhizobium sp. PSBB068]|jgi:transposase|nr:transposase family protein [Bradyrhizobium sp. PSBB068]